MNTSPLHSIARAFVLFATLTLAAFTAAAGEPSAGDEPGRTTADGAPAPRFELPGPGAPPDGAQKKQASGLEKQARELVKKGDCSAALPLFAEAHRLNGSESSVEATLACRESRGELVAAYELAVQLLRITPQKSAARGAREQKVAELAGRTALLSVSVAERHTAVEIDGERVRLGGDKQGVVRVSAGEHRVSASKQRFKPFEKSVTLQGGQKGELSIALEAIPLPVTTSVDRKQVIDFCYLAPSADTSRSQKQRLVLFKLSGRELSEAPEGEKNEKGEELKGVVHHALRDAAIHNHVRGAFLSTVLMERFYTVEASVESPQELSKRPFLKDDEMIAAAGVDSFAAYSLACTDWVALPRVAAREAFWQKVKVTETKDGKKVDRYVWQLSVVWKVEADIYQREKHGFALRATVEGENDGLFATAMFLASLAPQKGGITSALPISKRPEPGCNPPLLPELKKLAETALDCTDALTRVGKMASRVLNDEEASDEDKPAEGGGEASKAAADKAEQTAGNVVKDKKESLAQEVAGLGGDKAAEIGKVVNGQPVAKDALAGAADASGAGEAVKAAEAAISAQEKAVLEALSLGDSAAVDQLLALEKTIQNSRLLRLVARTKRAFDACQKPVGAIQAASDRLKTLSQQGPAALGIPAVVGLASCAGIELAPDLSVATAPGADQRQSKFCQNVKNDVSLGAQAMQSVAVCESRVGMEHAGLMLKKHLKELRGMRLFATLRQMPGPDPSLVGLALGAHEGVHRGDVYVAVLRQPDGTFTSAGFGRIRSEGPGGDAGLSQLSEFRFRNGVADKGTHMEEHPQVGVPLGVRPLVKYYLFKGNLETSLAIGGALEGGYNASRFIPIADEVWGRASLSFSAGQGNEFFFDAELGPEVVHYLGSGFAAFGGVGFDFQYAFKEVEITPTQKESAGGINFGGLLTLGLDYAFSPDWNARLSAGYRQGGSGTTLENNAKTVSIDAGSLSAVQGGLSAGYTF